MRLRRLVISIVLGTVLAGLVIALPALAFVVLQRKTEITWEDESSNKDYNYTDVGPWAGSFEWEDLEGDYQQSNDDIQFKHFSGVVFTDSTNVTSISGTVDISGYIYRYHNKTSPCELTCGWFKTSNTEFVGVGGQDTYVDDIVGGTIEGTWHRTVDVYGSVGESVRGAGLHCEALCGYAAGSESQAHTFEVDFQVIELVIDGDVVTQTECIQLTSLDVSGPPTTTVGAAATFNATAGPEQATAPVTWTWSASGSPVIEDLDLDHDLDSEVDITWWHEGQKTVTATAQNECSVVQASTTISVTDIPFDPPFDPPDDPGRPEYPPNCNCDGQWLLSKLWCYLQCWFGYFRDFLLYLWYLLQALLINLANTIIEWVWKGLMRIWLLLGQGIQKLIYWLKAIIKAIQESEIILGIAEWINCVVHNISVWWNWQTREVGTWLRESWDNYAYFVAESYWNLQDFVTTQIRVEVISRWFNESWANVVNWAKDTVQAQTQGGYWQWEEITDYLSDTVKAWRDWILGLEDAVIDWLNEQSEYMGYVWMQDLSDAIRAWLNHYAARIIEAMAPGYYTARGVIEGIRDLWDQIKARIFGIVIGFTTSIVETIVSAFELASFAAELAGELVIGFKDAINADSKAELYEGYGDLYYFFRGLQFFEDAAGDSPLAVLNLVSLGMIGVGLLYWTIGQVNDIADDISRM